MEQEIKSGRGVRKGGESRKAECTDISAEVTNNDIRTRVGRRLRELRLQRNYSQEAVAAELEVADSTLSGWECGTRAITLDMLARVAHYYDVSIGELVDSRKDQRLTSEQ